MQELLQLLPGAQRALFRLYHFGGCSSCGFRPDETVDQVCQRNGNLNPEEVIQSVQEACLEDEKSLITPVEAQRSLKAGTAKFLDIRTKEEFEAVAIVGSTLFNQEKLQEIMSHWPKDDLLVIVDHQGARSLDAAAYFAGHGFTNVKALRGGIDAWSLEVDSSLPRYTIE